MKERREGQLREIRKRNVKAIFRLVTPTIILLSIHATVEKKACGQILGL